jgi:hypothetical protein
MRTPTLCPAVMCHSADRFMLVTELQLSHRTRGREYLVERKSPCKGQSALCHRVIMMSLGHLQLHASES